MSATNESIANLAAVLAEIRELLAKRSGRIWSVRKTNGQHSTWIRITAPNDRLRDDGTMTRADMATLSQLLAVPYCDLDGYLCSAHGSSLRDLLRRAQGLAS
jgi:hypothetical protein